MNLYNEEPLQQCFLCDAHLRELSSTLYIIWEFCMYSSISTPLSKMAQVKTCCTSGPVEH